MDDPDPFPRPDSPIQWGALSLSAALVCLAALVVWVALSFVGARSTRAIAMPSTAPSPSSAPFGQTVPVTSPDPTVSDTTSPDMTASGAATPTPDPSTPTSLPGGPGWLIPGQAGSGRVEQFYVTFYAARDNTPPNSRDIAYPTVHDLAGGTGTVNDPITFATDRSELPVGTRVYYLNRYFVMEDDCTECDQEWDGSGPNGGPRFAHIDLYAGSATDPGIVACEDSLTKDGEVDVLVNPPSNLPVDSSPLYADGRCYTPR